MKTIKLLAILYLAFHFTSCQKENLEPELSATLNTNSSVKLSFNNCPSISSHPLMNIIRPMFYKSATTVFQNDLWRVASYETDTMQVTISRSTDGISWNEITVLPDNYAPGHLQLVVFGEELWLLGNRAPEDRFSDPLFKSIDGITWTKVVGPFASRAPRNIFVFRNRLYVQTSDGSILFTENGVKWVGVTHFLPNALSRNSKIIVFKDAIYAFTRGYYDFRSRRAIPVEIWKSKNVRDWELLPNTNPFFSPRGGYSVTAYNGKIWVIGGSYYSSTSNITYNEIWSTSDVKTWKKCSHMKPIEPMKLQSATVFENKLWLFNGTKRGYSHTNTYEIRQDD